MVIFRKFAASDHHKSHRMRSIFLPIIIAISLLVGCNKSAPEAAEALSRAESVMEEHPDSALDILTRLDTACLRTDADRALYALLYTQAHDKNYIDDTTDIVITKAVDFYRNSDNPYRAMLAHYYKGRIHENANDYGEALYQLMRSYKLAEERQDNLWVGRISRSISDIYTITFNSQEAIKFAKIAHDAMSKTGNPIYIRETLFDYIRMLHNARKYDSAMVLYPMLFEMGRNAQDSMFIQSIRYVYAKTLIGLDKPAEAVSEFKKINTSNDSTRLWTSYLLLAYANNGNLAEAKRIIDSRNDLHDVAYLGGIYSYYNQTKDYEKALRALEEQNRIGNKDIDWYMGQNLTGSLTKLIEEEDRTHKTEIKAERTIWIASIVLVISILVVLALSVIFRYRNRQNQLVARLESMDELTNDYNNICEKLEDLQKKVLQSKYKLADSFFSSIYVEGDDEKTRKKFLATLTKQLNAIGNDETTQKEIESWVDNNADGIITKFHNLPINMKDADRKVFLYSVLGFSTNTMAILINAPDLMSVYNRRKRLRNKISKLKTQENNVNTDEFLKYLSDGKHPEKDASPSAS